MESSETNKKRPARVLHVLAVSVPHQDGYTVRSRYIVETQRAEGFETAVATSPFYPGREASTKDCSINGVPYFRIPHPIDAAAAKRAADFFCRLVHRTRKFLAGKFGRAAGAPSALLQYFEESLLLRRFERELTRIARDFRPDVIHAHSPYRCFRAAAFAGRRLRVPVVYEVRGLWEESNVAAGRFRRGGLKFRTWRKRETAAMKRADAVVCICEGLRDDVARRGIAPEKIFVAPNAVDASRFASDAPQTRSGSRTLGYAGSVRKLEGVDCFIRAGAQIIGAGFDASLLIVGDGPELDNVKALAARLDIAGRCLFTGAVPHAEMKSYYAMMDVFVISRPDIPVARVVTPLKPLEAMAAGRALVAPDMPSFREIVKDGETGLLYPAGDERALAEKCAALLRDEALRERLGRNAARWVRESRTWADAMKGTFAAYRFALGLTKNAPLSEDERSDAATSLLKAS